MPVSAIRDMVMPADHPVHRLVTFGALVALGALMLRHPGNPLVMALVFWWCFEVGVQVSRHW
jgi:hypothetical protein